MDDRDDRARGPDKPDGRLGGHPEPAGPDSRRDGGSRPGHVTENPVAENPVAEDHVLEVPAGAGGSEPGRAPAGGGDGVRISAVEAAVAAGLVPSTTRHREARARATDDAPPDDRPAVLELPDWSDPPTGQVPRVLLGADEELPRSAPAVRGPTWREDRADWEDEVDLSFLLEHDDGPPGGGATAVTDDDDVDDEAWSALLGGFEAVPADRASSETATTGEAVTGSAWRSWPRVARAGSRARRHGTHRAARSEAEPAEHAFAGEPSPSWARRDRAPRRRAASPSPARRSTHRSMPGRREAEPMAPTTGPKGRSAVVATMTGLVAGGVALGCLAAGPVAALVLVAVVVTLAAGEAFGALRRSGRRPATPLGLVAVPSMLVAAYLRGPRAVPVVLGAAVVLGFVWHLVSSGRRPPGEKGLVADLGSTLLVLCWVGLLGSFAGLLLDPAAFPHRHGVAYLAAVVACSAAADVGAYATGAKLGRHLLAPRVSPHKSVEGLVGGTVLALAVAGLAIVHLHPFDVELALSLGAAVVVLAPVGDLAESLVKRDLGLKDMGNLLPAHGGVLDRVDAMLFVLPAAYILVRLVHP